MQQLCYRPQAAPERMQLHVLAGAAALVMLEHDTGHPAKGMLGR